MDDFRALAALQWQHVFLWSGERTICSEAYELSRTLVNTCQIQFTKDDTVRKKKKQPNNRFVCFVCFFAKMVIFRYPNVICCQEWCNDFDSLVDYVLFTWDSDKYHFSIITVTVLELKFSLLQQNLVIRVDSGSLSNLWQLGHSGFTAQFRSSSVLSLWGGQSLPAVYVFMTKLDVNHRIVWVGSDLKDNLVLTLLLWAGTPF